MNEGSIGLEMIIRFNQETIACKLRRLPFNW